MPNPSDHFTKETDTRFTLRIDAELLERIRQNAQKNKRSTAKEIIFMLEQYLDTHEK